MKAAMRKRKTTMIERAAAILVLALCACVQPADAPAQSSPGISLFSATPESVATLPHRLREISGLALAPDGRVFAHDDESAVVFEIDPASGDVRKRFSLGDRPERGDFEGIAITPQGEFWLMTSNGRLYRFREGADGGHVAFERFDSGLRRTCELEGLAYLASERSLILACKDNYHHRMRHTIALYSWRIGAAGEAVPWRTMSEDAVAEAAGVHSFHPSSIEIDPVSGRILLLSARDAALAEFGPDGGLLAARRLGRRHVQPEGMTVAADGTLIISDEGAGGQAIVTRYERTGG